MVINYGDNMQTVSAGEFKTKCLKLMDVVHDTHEEFIITKHGVPVAKMVPIESIASPFGLLKGSITITGDIVSYELDEKWEADE